MQRPNVVTITGILNVVFGGFGLLGAPITLASIYWLEKLTRTANPLKRILEEDSFVRSWMFGSMAVSFVASVFLIIAGAGMLGMRRWGRRLSLLYAAFALVFGVAGIVINATAIAPALLHEAARRSGPSAAAATGGAIGGVIGGTLGGVLSLGYPVVLFYLLTRENVRSAFAASRSTKTG